MNKPFRFMIEYANYQKRCIDVNTEVNKGIREELKRRIDRTIKMYKSGFITIDEYMRLIANPAYENEDLSQYEI